MAALLGRSVSTQATLQRCARPTSNSAANTALPKPRHRCVAATATSLIQKPRRFVGVDVVHSRGEADDQTVVDRDCEMMPGIRKKFGGKIRVNRVIEHTRGDSRQNVFIAAPQDPDFDRHAVRG
jgi:hypothetical protein